MQERFREGAKIQTFRRTHRRKVPCITMCPCDFDSGTFWNILEPSGTFRSLKFSTWWHTDTRTHGHTDGQTDIRTSRAAPSQLKIWWYFGSATVPSFMVWSLPYLSVRLGQWSFHSIYCRQHWCASHIKACCWWRALATWVPHSDRPGWSCWLSCENWLPAHYI